MAIRISTTTTRSRMSASRSAKAVAKAIGDRKHPPLRPFVRAARRGAVARRDRLLRPAGLEFHVPFTRARIGTFDVDLSIEFFRGFVNHAGVTLHIDNLRGINAHHQLETVFRPSAVPLRARR